MPFLKPQKDCTLHFLDFKYLSLNLPHQKVGPERVNTGHDIILGLGVKLNWIMQGCKYALNFLTPDKVT